MIRESIEIARENTLRRNARVQVSLSRFHVEPLLNGEVVLEQAAFNMTFTARSGRSVRCDNLAIASANSITLSAFASFKSLAAISLKITETKCRSDCHRDKIYRVKHLKSHEFSFN